MEVAGLPDIVRVYFKIMNILNKGPGVGPGVVSTYIFPHTAY